MMTRAQRNILGQVVKALLLSTLTMLTVISLLRSEGLIEKVINRNLSITFLFRSLLLVAPSLVQYVLPITTALSVVFVYAKLAGSNEMVVMRASGMSHRAIAAPAVLVSLVSVAVCFAISIYVTPATFAAFKDLERFIQSDLAALSMHEGRFNRFGDDVTVYVREITAGGEMRGVLLQDNRSRDHRVFLIAEDAAMVPGPTGFSVVMANGNRQESKPGEKPSIVYFDRYEFELPRDDVFRAGSHNRGITERSLAELLHPSAEDRRDPGLETRMLAEGHQRLISPLLALAYPLFGLVVMLSGSLQRRGPALRVIAITAVIAAMQILHMSLMNLAAGDRAMIPAQYVIPIGGVLVCLALLLVIDAKGPGRWFGRRRLAPPIPA